MFVDRRRHRMQREDGFMLCHSTGGCGWDIHAPLDTAGIEAMLGARAEGRCFAWAEDMEAAEVKIEREKRERLWH